MNSQDTYIFCAAKPQIDKYYPFLASDKKSLDEFIQKNWLKDTYYTVNYFKDATGRRRDNVAIANAIVIDIDDHTLMGGFDINAAMNLVGLLEPHFNADIPTPSRVIHTGRGVHVYFKIEPTTDIAKYETVCKKLFYKIDMVIGQYFPLSSSTLKRDTQAASPNNFWRIPGTYNTKARTISKEIYYNPAQYTLDELITDFVPELNIIINGTTTPLEHATNTAYSEFKQFRADFTAMSWRLAAIDDLKTLQNARKEVTKLDDNKYYFGSNKGHRNNFIFILGVLAKWAFNDSQDVLETMQAFNKFYGNEVLDDSEVMATYKSVMTKGYKTPRAKTIIEKLDIKPQEQTLLKVLINQQEKNRRNKTNRKRYKASLTEQSRQVKQDLIARVKELHANGMSYRNIAKEVGISYKTVCTYVKK